MDSSRHHKIDPTTATPSSAGAVDGADLNGLDGRQCSKSLSVGHIDQEHLYHSDTSEPQACVDNNPIDNTYEEEDAFDASTSKNHISSKAFGKTRATDDISAFGQLDEHQDFTLIRTTSQHIDPLQTTPPQRRRDSLTKNLPRRSRRNLHHRPTPNLPSTPNPNQTPLQIRNQPPQQRTKSRLNYIQHWNSETKGTGKIQRSLQILEKKVQRFQAAARKKCIAVNPELCRIHGARHRDRNTYLQSMPGVDLAETPLNSRGVGLVDGIFDVQKYGTRLPSEASTVSDFEARVEEGVPARLARRRGGCWDILVSPYWGSLLFLMFVVTGLKVNRQLKGEGFM